MNVLLTQSFLQLGVPGLDLKVGQKYTVRVELVAKKDNPFGSLPKFLGIKLSENYTQADRNAQGGFEASQGRPLLGEHGCSIGQGKADGCDMLTSKYDTTCPMEKDGDKFELEFPFSAANIPSAVSTTKFRFDNILFLTCFAGSLVSKRGPTIVRQS